MLNKGALHTHRSQMKQLVFEPQVQSSFGNRAGSEENVRDAQKPCESLIILLMDQCTKPKKKAKKTKTKKKTRKSGSTPERRKYRWGTFLSSIKKVQKKNKQTN